MSQQKKLEFSDRLRTLRKSLDLSQEAMGSRLGVSGNYIHLLEGGREPGESLLKLFEVLEGQNAETVSLSEETPGGYPTRGMGPQYAKLTSETLGRTMSELAASYPDASEADKYGILMNLFAIITELLTRRESRQHEVILHQKDKPKPSNSARVSEAAASSKSALERMGSSYGKGSSKSREAGAQPPRKDQPPPPSSSATKTPPAAHEEKDRT